MKTIVKSILLASACAMFSLHADPLLYWMVNDGSSSEVSAGAPVNTIEFSYARLTYVNTDSLEGKEVSGDTYGGNSIVPLVGDNGNYYVASAKGGTGTGTVATWADFSGISNLASQTFFIELYDSSWNRVGQSAGMTYGNLVSANAVVANSLNIGQLESLTVWAPAFGVPEPTSGLLMIIGGSLLALRRRRKVA